MGDSQHWWRQAIRFGISGGLNTAVTALALFFLAKWIEPTLAYTIVFAFGIALSTFLTGRYVFRVPMGPRKVSLYVLLYLAVYLVGLGVVALASRWGLPPEATALVVLITAPLTFVGARLIVVERGNATLTAANKEELP